MLSLSNDFYCLTVDENMGKIVFFGKEENLLADCDTPMFRVGFLNEKGERIILSSFDAKSFEIEKLSDTKLSFIFSGFSLSSLKVTVILDCEKGDNLARFRISVTSSEQQLEWVEPIGITSRDCFASTNEGGSILLPYNEGVLVEDVDIRYGHGWQYTDPEYPSKGNYSMYPGMMSSPFLAVMSPKGGIYLGAHDSSEQTKCLDFYRFENGVRLQMRIYPASSTETYTTDFDTVLGYFDGDWQDGAEIYRSWFEENLPQGFVKIKDNKALPKWYSESPVILAYTVRGHHDTDDMTPNRLFPFVNAMPIVERLNRELEAPVMSLLMHWEGTAPWAPPYVWPPFGGEEGLREYIEALHKSGNYAGLYCSGLGWTQRSNLTDYSMEERFEKENLKEVMCQAPDGSLPLSNICTAQRSGYDLCPTQEFCRQTIVAEARKMIGSNVDYIQLMDQNHGGTPYFCYSKTHGHPPVPGKWQSDALKSIMAEINGLEGAERVLFGCESAAAQTFIPQFLFSDNRFEINYLLGVPVPLYSFLYHPYVNNFMGNQVLGEEIMDCHNCKDNLYFRIAYSFVAGDFLTLVINDEGKIQWAWGQKNFDNDYMPDYGNVIKLTRRLNSFRRGRTSKFLSHGKMIKPFVKISPEKHCITAARRVIEVEDLLTAAYVAPDGEKAQVIVNYNEREVECFSADFRNTVYLISPNSNPHEAVGNKIKIEPLSAVIILKKRDE